MIPQSHRRPIKSHFSPPPPLLCLVHGQYTASCSRYATTKFVDPHSSYRWPYSSNSPIKVYQALAQKNNCSLPPELSRRWPLGIDRIKQIWDANMEERLLAFLCTVADAYAPLNTIYQVLLLGPRAFHNLDPTNVESILASDFKSESSQAGDSSWKRY
jgi:hypothetical protein